MPRDDLITLEYFCPEQRKHKKEKGCFMMYFGNREVVKYLSIIGALRCRKLRRDKIL